MKLQEWLRKSQLLLIIACGSYPLVMILLDRTGSGMLPWGWAYLAAYVIFSLVGMKVRGRWRLTLGIFLAGAMTAGAFFLSPAEARWGSLAAVGLCSGLLLWSLKLAGWSSRQEIPVLWVAYGVLAHLLGQLLIYMDKVDGGQGLAVYSGSMLASLFGFALLTMLSMNRGSLVGASGKRQSVPDSMRRKNGLLVIGLFVLAVAASFLPSLFSAVTGILRQGIGWMVWLISRLFPKKESDSVGNVPTGGEMGMPVMGGEERVMELNPIVEKLMMFFGAVLFFALLLYVLYRLYRILEGLLRRMLNNLGRFASGVGEDYIDEITDTREDGAAEKVEKERLVSRLPFLEPKNLSPGERIRFRYQRLMRRHPEWEPGSTARETLPETVAGLYEQARYSDHPVSETDAVAFSDGIKSL